MVQTLLNIRDDLYKKLVELSLNRYGHTKAISKVLNEILEEVLESKKGWKIKVTVRLNKKIDLSPEPR